jgi:hypothetical protein
MYRQPVLEWREEVGVTPGLFVFYGFVPTQENEVGLKAYAIGDDVVLKAGLTRIATGDRRCRIVGLLPAAERGESQYRVRMGTENFERRIVQSDIDPDETTVSAERNTATSSAPAGGSWLNTSSIRIGK